MLSASRLRAVPVFAEFVDSLWRALAGGRAPALDVIGTWRVIRRVVLAELAVLGLAATVVRTEGAGPLARHDGRAAGLVLLHPLGSPADWPRSATPHAERERRYRGRMLAEHGLVAVDGPDTDLRRFCGQSAGYAPPAWADHARTWVDRWGEIVLSVEPYWFDPVAVVRDLDGLPLAVEGPHPGVRNDSATLLLLRPDPGAEVLPAEVAEPSGPDVAEVLDLALRVAVAEQVAGRALRAVVPAPRRSAVTGLVGVVLAAERPAEVLRWAAGKLAAHVLAGHLTDETARLLLTRIADRVPGADAAAVAAEAYRAEYRRALGLVGTEVRAALGEDWPMRVARLAEGDPAAVDALGLAGSAGWLADVQAAEVYG